MWHQAKASDIKSKFPISRNRETHWPWQCWGWWWLHDQGCLHATVCAEHCRGWHDFIWGISWDLPNWRIRSGVSLISNSRAQSWGSSGTLSISLADLTLAWLLVDWLLFFTGWWRWGTGSIQTSDNACPFQVPLPVCGPCPAQSSLRPFAGRTGLARDARRSSLFSSNLKFQSMQGSNELWWCYGDDAIYCVLLSTPPSSLWNG